MRSIASAKRQKASRTQIVNKQQQSKQIKNDATTTTAAGTDGRDRGSGGAGAGGRHLSHRCRKYESNNSKVGHKAAQKGTQWAGHDTPPTSQEGDNIRHARESVRYAATSATCYVISVSVSNDKHDDGNNNAQE